MKCNNDIFHMKLGTLHKFSKWILYVALAGIGEQSECLINEFPFRIQFCMKWLVIKIILLVWNGLLFPS